MHILILIKWCDQREKNACHKQCVASDEWFFFQSKKNRFSKSFRCTFQIASHNFIETITPSISLPHKADPECCHPNQMSPPSASSPTFACLRAGEGEGTDFKARNLSLCRELNRNGTSFVYTLMKLGVMVIYFLLLKISTNGLWRKKCSLTFT